jgi:hypothetical protein
VFASAQTRIKLQQPIQHRACAVSGPPRLLDSRTATNVCPFPPNVYVAFIPDIRPGHLYVRPGANRNHTGDRGEQLVWQSRLTFQSLVLFSFPDPSESRSSSSHRRTSYITIVTGDEPSIPMELDFSQGGIDRFMSSSSAPIDELQFSWGGTDLPTGSEDLALPPELEPLSEDEMGPWGKTHSPYSLTRSQADGFIQPLNLKIFFRNMWEALVYSLPSLPYGIIFLT